MAYYTSLASAACCLPTKSKCRHTCSKYVAETKPVTVLWQEAAACSVDATSGTIETDWTLSTVTYNIVEYDGTALTGAATDPIVAIHPTLLTTMETVSRHKMLSRVMISGGVAGEIYRLVATATFTDCDSFQMICEYCVGLQINEE